MNRTAAALSDFDRQGGDWHQYRRTAFSISRNCCCSQAFSQLSCGCVACFLVQLTARWPKICLFQLTKRQDKSRPEDKTDPDIVVRVLKIQTFTWETLKKSKRWQNSINIQSSKVQSLIKNCQKTNHLLWETWPRPAKWIHSEVEGDMMWDIYEDDDSFEKMAKAKVT